MVGGFEKAMAEAGKTDLTVHWYEANHAFANPSGSRYDAEDTKRSWSRTMALFGIAIATAGWSDNDKRIALGAPSA